MAASGSAARARPHGERRSIRLTVAALVAVPSVALFLLCAAAAGLLATAPDRRPLLSSHRELAAALLAGASLVVLLVAVAVARSFAVRLSEDIRDLAEAAGDGPRPRTGSAEIALAEAAVAALRRAEQAAAAGDAGLREGVRQVYTSLARRNQSLLQRQLRLIDELEQKAADPAALADLFALDHLTTRMRRHAESLAVLSGAAPGRPFRDPVPVVDVIRGAMAEIEDYTRVVTPTVAADAVLGPAAADMMHLLAELIENATLCSPSGTQVEVRAGLVAHGLAVEIDDRGLGIEPGRLEELNRMLASPPDFDLADADRLGLFVTARLAARHGVRVSLRPSPYGGITAIVLMPASIIVPAAGRGGTSQGVRARAEPAGPAAVSQRAARRLAVAGRLSASAGAWSPVRPTTPADGTAASAASPGLADRADLAPETPAAETRAAETRAAATQVAATPAAATPAAATPAAATPAAAASAAATPTTAAQGTALAPHVDPAQPPDQLADHRPGTAPDRQDAGHIAVDPGSVADQGTGTYRGLPRRARQASLSPHLRDGRPADRRARAGAEPGPEPSPDRARDLAAAWQSGWQRERGAEPDSGPGTGAAAAGQSAADRISPGPPRADLSHPEPPQPGPQPELPRPDLPRADLPATDLPRADLPRADLPAADLPAADLPRADLPSYDQPGADPAPGEEPS